MAGNKIIKLVPDGTKACDSSGASVQRLPQYNPALSM